MVQESNLKFITSTIKIIGGNHTIETNKYIKANATKNYWQKELRERVEVYCPTSKTL